MGRFTLPRDLYHGEGSLAELKNLKGLMYFTDGYGEYPKKPTDYQTVFVFYGDDTPQKTFSGEPIKVPDWAVKLYLSEDTKG